MTPEPHGAATAGQIAAKGVTKWTAPAALRAFNGDSESIAEDETFPNQNSPNQNSPNQNFVERSYRYTLADLANLNSAGPILLQSAKLLTLTNRRPTMRSFIGNLVPVSLRAQ
ncbi:MAG TPA: hypothetical protein VFE24_18160 [Pirellulales bacterium]|nr:hypothetical protein [Pirellulales bacterium]